MEEEIVNVTRRPPLGPTLPEGSSATQVQNPTTVPANVRASLLLKSGKIRATVVGAGYPSVPTLICGTSYFVVYFARVQMPIQLEITLTETKLFWR